MQLTDLALRNEQAIRIAGPRYTPGVDPSAPNLRIEHLVRAVQALTLSGDFKRHVEGLEKDLSESLRSARYTVDPLFRRNKTTPDTLVSALAQLRGLADPTDIGRQVGELIKLARRIDGLLEHRRNDLYEQQRLLVDDESTREARSRLDSRIQDVSNVTYSISSVLDYLGGVPGRLLTKGPCLFLHGAWGTGKTHFLCDIAKGSIAEGTPALLLIGSSLPPATDPLDAVASCSGLAGSGDDLLDELERLGATVDRRALLMIDAINEGDRAEWRRKLVDVVNRVAQRPHVGLILSCRRPFELSILTPAARKRIVETEHFGFQDLEVDAQLAYFDHYGISAPTVPLLTPEFSRPLFLKLLCDGMARLTRHSKNRSLKEVASGQKGMTYVLEHFAKSVGAPIESDFGLPRLTCWKLLKGEPNKNHLGIAGAMAQHSRDFLTSDEILACVVDSSSLPEATARELIRRMIVDGLLAEDMRWHEDSYSDAVVFPYQRFGDHLIARHLLDAHLDPRVATENSIRHSLYAGRPLGEPFEIDKWRNSFKYPGIAAALMLEFPERMKRSSLSRELFDYLPKSRKYVGPIKEVLLEGLYWRDRESFTPETGRLVSVLLNLDDRFIRYEAFEVLVGLATRSQHPYNATTLLKYLTPVDMSERDRTWSEYVGGCDDNSIVHRLLAWIEKTAGRHRTEREVQNEIRLLSLLLTTSSRYTRDRVTRSLMLLGLHNARVLFNETISSLNFNDPYVAERMLAASYGVVMRLWAAPNGDHVRTATPSFARDLVRQMFLPGATHSTSHTLRRGYASGIIQLARQIDRHAIATQHVKYLDTARYPSPSPFRAANRIKTVDVEDVRSVMHMDFENYTLGRLVQDRANYQSNHVEYQAVRKQILWRVKDLGYTVEKFEEIDRIIGQANWRERDGKKVDRFGKKYSWIAFFEMYGVRSDQGKLEEDRMIERSSDCDVDPSFPEQPLTWKPSLPDVFDQAPKEVEPWLRSRIVPDYEALLYRDDVDGHQGPWILLDGFVLRQTDEREVFTFLRGVMIRDGRPFRALSEVVAKTEYLGNHRIPEEGADYYLFAGEIPWSQMYGAQEGRTGGRRQIDRAFYGYKHGKWGGIPLEVPIRRWAWESYHSELNQVSGIDLPSPSICNSFNLRSHDAGFDLFDTSGVPASLYREWPADDDDGFTRSHVLYLRTDLMDLYLQQTSQRFIWIPWGERNVHYRRHERGLSAGATRALQEHVNCFGSVVHFDQDPI